MDKILGLVATGSVIANAASTHRITSGLVDILVLTLVGSLIASVLIVGAFLVVYLGLVHFGLNSYVAGLTVAILMFASMGIIFLIVALRMRRLRETSSRRFRHELLRISPMINVVEAFMEGLLWPHDKNPR